MRQFTVLLDSGAGGESTGTIDEDKIDFMHTDDFIGERMTAKSHDENGNEIEVAGILIETLGESFIPW